MIVFDLNFTKRNPRIVHWVSGGVILIQLITRTNNARNRYPPHFVDKIPC